MVSFLIISILHFWLCEGDFYVACGSILSLVYCAFQKYANSEVEKSPSQLHFSLLSILIAITSNNGTLTQKKHTQMDWNPPITNYKPWPFEPTEVNFCFLRGLLRLLMGAKNANISCLFNFRIRVFLERTVNFYFQFCFKLIIILYHTQKWKKRKFRPRINWTMASILRREWYDVSQALSKAKVILFHVSWNEHGDCLYY